jgi:hypothetical protein
MVSLEVRYVRARLTLTFNLAIIWDAAKERAVVGVLAPRTSGFYTCLMEVIFERHSYSSDRSWVPMLKDWSGTSVHRPASSLLYDVLQMARSAQPE